MVVVVGPCESSVRLIAHQSQLTTYASCKKSYVPSQIVLTDIIMGRDNEGSKKKRKKF